jgi:uncharacterized membrane protein
MKKLVRCKACGYIMEEGKLGDKCPACGAPKAAFMPYVDTMGARRRNILKLDLHPIAVHFPVSFSVAMLVFSIALFFLAGDARTFLINTNKVLVLLIPVMVIIAGTAGYIDGKIRFRKVGNSQILKRKILYASIFLAASIALAVVVWVSGLESPAFITASVVLAAIASGMIVILSLLGTSILEAAFPGN